MVSMNNIINVSTTLHDTFRYFATHNINPVLKKHLLNFLRNHIVIDHPLSTHDVSPLERIFLELWRPYIDESVEPDLDAAKFIIATGNENIVDALNAKIQAINVKYEATHVEDDFVHLFYKLDKFRDPDILSLPAHFSDSIRGFKRYVNQFNALFTDYRRREPRIILSAASRKKNNNP